MIDSGEIEPTLSDIKRVFIAGGMGALIHRELVANLVAKENDLVKEETEKLVRLNHTEYDGSPDGFFFENELFHVGAAFGKEGILVIAPELAEQAALLKENRSDIPQYTTYIAHFLSYLGNRTEDPIEYVANIPPGLSKFSPSLNKLESLVEQQAAEDIPAAKYDPDDADKEIFFMHYKRVEEPLNRFLFRKLTRT